MSSESSNQAREEMKQVSRRSFMWAAVYVVGGYSAIKFLGTRAADKGTGWVFRRVLETNEGVAKDLFDLHKPVPTFSAKAITEDRYNGTDGLEGEFDAATWKLRLVGIQGADGPIELTIEDLKKLPRTEMITQFCCIEGWSSIQKWAGVRLIDLMAIHPPAATDTNAPDLEHLKNLPRYVSISTPDGGYYVGLDIEAATHPQTLLAYEHNGGPLKTTDGDEVKDHGEPLRLIIPVKYGVKNLKRIGTIEFTNERPRDFWGEQGYDWYAGL